MFSLSYTPAYDPYHTVFRYLVLLTSAENLTMPYRVARAADFFLCFPWALNDVRAPRDIAGFRKSQNNIVKKYPPSEYDHFSCSRVVFERMEIIQGTAVSALAGEHMIELAALKQDKITLIPEKLSDALVASIESFRSKKPDLVQFLSESFPKIAELGKDGIYARSSLGDFHYDVL